MEPRIIFESVDVSLPGFVQAEIVLWLDKVFQSEKNDYGDITFIFCSDEYLYELNKEYLNHNDLTDVITFDYGDEVGMVSGDIFISTERVADNALQLEVDYLEELYRVMVHGVLHLLGYKDKDAGEKELMRSREDEYLKLILRS